jgi:hypothetical protein
LLRKRADLKSQSTTPAADRICNSSFIVQRPPRLQKAGKVYMSVFQHTRYHKNEIMKVILRKKYLSEKVNQPSQTLSVFAIFLLEKVSPHFQGEPAPPRGGWPGHLIILCLQYLFPGRGG